jgi:hypothetical protein
VSCGGYTCCPKGTTCKNKGSGWGVVSMCAAADSEDSADSAELVVAYPQFLHIVGSASAAGTVGAQVCNL